MSETSQNNLYWKNLGASVPCLLSCLWWSSVLAVWRVLFLLKTTVAHRRFKSSECGMAYERWQLLLSKTFFGGKKATTSEVYLWAQLFGQIRPTGIVTLHSELVPSSATMPHQSDSYLWYCRRTWDLRTEEETGTHRNALFSIARTAAVHRSLRGS